MGLRNYTIKRQSQGIYTAFNTDLLSNTIAKIWDGMEFLNTSTRGGMKRLRMVKNTAEIRRASQKLKDGTEIGFKSEVRTVITDNPRKLRGSRVERLFFEESGSHPLLLKTYSQGQALVEVGATKVGMRFTWGCVCKDTVLYRSDGTPVLVQDLKLGDEILGFDNGQTTIEPITYIQEPCDKPCYEITTKYGNLKCSFDHPILTRKYYNYKKDGKVYWRYDYVYKMAQDITNKDFIIYSDGIQQFGNDELKDPYFIGILIGDGSYGRNKTPRLFSCDPEIYNYVENKYDVVCERSHITKDEKLYKELRINGTSNQLRDCGIYGQTKANKRLPSNYQTLSKESLAELIAGLYDTDGYFSKSRHVIELDQSSEELIKQIQECLIKFGIYSTYFEHKPLLKEGRKDRNSWFVLNIRDQQSIVNFYKNIPIKVKYKQDNLKLQIQNIKPKKRILKEGYREVKVDSITDIGIQPIYNLTANNTHTYIANNIVTHNTGGDSGPALAGLASIFYDPKAFNVLPYKHTNNLQKEVVYTGFFIPAWAMVWQCMDHRGFCSEEKGRRYYDKNRLEKSNNAEALMIYKSEYCYVPEEALIREGNNRFDSEKLAEQLANIELHKIVKPPIKGTLSWPLDTNTGKHDFTKRPSFNLGENSKLEIVEYPMCDEHDIPYANLYCAGIDSIDGDASTSSQANSGDVSDFCIIIKKRQFGISEPKYVAIYKDRPKDVRTAYDNAFKLLQWYNCKAVVEATRVGIITYFKEKNSLNYLFKRPRATLSNPTSKNIKQYGALATPAVIDHQLELIEQFVYDYSHTIEFPQMIQELLKYSYENKRKFDIVAAMGMCELADEEMYGKSIKESTTQKEWRDIGYYYDEYGRKKYGVIPKR